MSHLRKLFLGIALLRMLFSKIKNYSVYQTLPKILVIVVENTFTVIVPQDSSQLTKLSCLLKTTRCKNQGMCFISLNTYLAFVLYDLGVSGVQIGILPINKYKKYISFIASELLLHANFTYKIEFKS